MSALKELQVGLLRPKGEEKCSIQSIRVRGKQRADTGGGGGAARQGTSREDLVASDVRQSERGAEGQLGQQD